MPKKDYKLSVEETNEIFKMAVAIVEETDNMKFDREELLKFGSMYKVYDLTKHLINEELRSRGYKVESC